MNFFNSGNTKKTLTTLLLTVLISVVAVNVAHAQYNNSTLTPPPPVPDKSAIDKEQKKSSVKMRYQVHPTVPENYEDLREGEYAADLKNPSNIVTEAEYDYETGCYIIHTKVGDYDVVTPFILTAEEYNDLTLRESMMQYYRQKNSETAEEKKKNPFNFLDMQFGLGPLEKVFGPGGVQLKTQGSVQIKMGIKTNKTDNPAL